MVDFPSESSHGYRRRRQRDWKLSTSATTTLSVWTNTEDCATRAAEASVSTCSPISQNFSRRTAILRCSNAPALKHCYNGCAKLRTHHSEQSLRTLTRRTVALNTRDC